MGSACLEGWRDEGRVSPANALTKVLRRKERGSNGPRLEVGNSRGSVSSPHLGRKPGERAALGWVSAPGSPGFREAGYEKLDTKNSEQNSGERNARRGQKVENRLKVGKQDQGCQGQRSQEIGGVLPPLSRAGPALWALGADVANPSGCERAAPRLLSSSEGTQIQPDIARAGLSGSDSP